jgi:PKD repeat protein
MLHVKLTYKTWLPALALVVCLLPAENSSANGPDNGNFTPLQNFVTAGKLHAGVKNELDRTGQAEMLLILDESDVRAVAGRMRESAGADHDTAEIVREKARLFAEKKSKVLSRIPPHDISVITDYTHFPITYVKVNENALAKLLDMPEVAFAGENGRVQPTLAQSLPLIGAPSAQSTGAGGSGTAVAVLDTGLNYTLSAFGSCTSPGVPASCKVVYVKEYTPDDDGSLDNNGHGTNVAGIVAGVAPDTKLLGLDVFQSDGAHDVDILRALNDVLDLRATYNIVAINMSLGSGKYTSACASDVLASAVSNLKNAGITSVIASGNDVYHSALARPACVPDAVSVGAVYDANVGGLSWGSGCTDSTTAADKVTCFSNSASFLTMLAPGALITAAGTTMGGTSQAAPHVAGAVAVLKGRYRDLTVDNVVTRLTSSGVAVYDSRNGFTKPRLALYSALTGLVIGKGGTGTGTVTSIPAGISCGNDCSEPYAQGTAVSLIATPDDNSTFTGWSGGGCYGTGACTATIANETMVTATFNIKPPVTSLLAAPVFGGAPLYVNFTDTSTNNPTAWLWSFGDGTTDSTRNPGHMYASPGTYTIVLTASNSSGSATTTASNYITVASCVNPPVRISSATPAYYSLLQNAYDYAAGGSILQAQAMDLSGDLSLDRDVAITLQGGYDCGYTANPAVATMLGTLRVTNGTVNIEKLRFK